MAKISIHRALTELKTAEKRIANEIGSAKFVAIRKGKADKINGVAVTDIEKEAQASYDKVIDLITRYRRLKAAIVLSNAGIVVETGIPVGVIKVAGEMMTVAEVIERKNSIKFERDLYDVMNRQYRDAQAKIERENLKVEARLDEYLKSMFGSDAKKTSADEVETHSKLFKENNEYNLIDPLKISGKIDALLTKIVDFETEVDAVLSENNATTFIDVD